MRKALFGILMAAAAAVPALAQEQDGEGREARRAERAEARAERVREHYQTAGERNQARAALQESARTMVNILENTTDGFFAVDAEWNFTHLNAEAETLLGRTRNELLGHQLWKEFPELAGSVS